MNERYTLAYGSNLSVDQMLHRCPDAVYVGTAELKNYRLLFKGSGSGYYLTVEPKRGRTVPVVVWKISEKDEKTLDAYEGFPRFYQKEELDVEVKNLIDGSPMGTVKAFMYVMDPLRLPGRPSELYYRICREGYNRFGFDEKILEKAYRESCGRTR